MTNVQNSLSQLFEQFKDSPNIVELITVFSERFDLLQTAIDQLLTINDLDNVGGVWVDRLGEIIGLERLNVENTENIFTLRDDDDPEDLTKGLSDDSEDPMTGGYLISDDGDWTEDRVPDQDYIDLLKLKIELKHGLPTINRLYYLLDRLGFTGTITEGPKSVLVRLSESTTLTQKAIITKLLPRTLGIRTVII
jgi:hypothetical protein